MTLSAQPSDTPLTGTLTVPLTQGQAVFGDLAFPTAPAEVRLVATAPGCEPATTAPFQVRAPQQQRSWDAVDRPVLPVSGRPVFFPDGRTLAVLDGRRLAVHTWTGSSYRAGDTAELRERPRLWAFGRRCLAVADWSGRVVLAAPDGTVTVRDLPAPQGARLNVPGALAFDEDALYVGMWSGSVWSFDDPEQVLNHPAGVQVLAADGERLVVGGLDGRLTEYVERRVVGEHTVEPVLLGMTRVRDFALAVGERRVHRLDLARHQLVQVDQPVTGITGALPGGDLTAIVDATGQGVCFDAELAVRVGFHTVPGAELVGCALGGRLLVVAHPDGTHALVREGRTTYVCAHPLAVSPDGGRAALSDGRRLLILPVEELGGEGTRP